MKTILLTLVLLGSGSAFAQECSRMCNPEKSKPCGNGCISKHLMCTKSWTTACVGTKELQKKKTYAEPKHVNPSDLDAYLSQGGK